jgi:hypothetical protein
MTVAPPLRTLYRPVEDSSKNIGILMGIIADIVTINILTKLVIKGGPANGA